VRAAGAPTGVHRRHARRDRLQAGERDAAGTVGVQPGGPAGAGRRRHEVHREEPRQPIPERRRADRRSRARAQRSGRRGDAADADGRGSRRDAGHRAPTDRGTAAAGARGVVPEDLARRPDRAVDRRHPGRRWLPAGAILASGLGRHETDAARDRSAVQRCEGDADWRGVRPPGDPREQGVDRRPGGPGPRAGPRRRGSREGRRYRHPHGRRAAASRRRAGPPLPNARGGAGRASERTDPRDEDDSELDRQLVPRRYDRESGPGGRHQGGPELAAVPDQRAAEPGDGHHRRLHVRHVRTCEGRPREAQPAGDVGRSDDTAAPMLEPELHRRAGAAARDPTRTRGHRDVASRLGDREPVDQRDPVTLPMTQPFVTEAFTEEERALLEPHFTNLQGPAFALTNLPEAVKGAMFARYSRTIKSLRRLFLDEFADDVVGVDIGTTAAASERAAGIYERVFVEYGDDSVAQLGGVHLACEQSSQLLAKELEWGRLAAYL